MLPGNPVRGLSTGEQLRVDNLEVASLHRDGAHRRRNHSCSQPLELNSCKQIDTQQPEEKPIARKKE